MPFLENRLVIRAEAGRPQERGTNVSWGLVNSNMEMFYSSCPLRGEQETNQGWGRGKHGDFQGKAVFLY